MWSGKNTSPEAVFANISICTTTVIEPTPSVNTDMTQHGTEQHIHAASNSNFTDRQPESDFRRAYSRRSQQTNNIRHSITFRYIYIQVQKLPKKFPLLVCLASIKNPSTAKIHPSKIASKTSTTHGPHCTILRTSTLKRTG